MTDLTSKYKVWVWDMQKENTAFKTLREHLTSSVIVAYLNFDLPFWIKTDASGGSLGYVLTQFVLKLVLHHHHPFLARFPVQLDLCGNGLNPMIQHTYGAQGRMF